MEDALNELLAAVRQAVDILAQEYAARRAADPAFDDDAYFSSLRRMIEGKATSLDLVYADGPMGGGGAGEA